jgi:hypothetical protein
MSPLFFNSFFILVQFIILKLNVSSHPPDTIFWSRIPTNFSYEPQLEERYGRLQNQFERNGEEINAVLAGNQIPAVQSIASDYY